MVLLFETIPELRSQLATARQKNHQIGLVPTMGALHEGHLSLIKRAIAENDTVVVSIFVNPLQFAPTEDLVNYPRQLEQDLELCASLGVDYVFAPNSQEINSSGDTQALTRTTTVIPPQDMTKVLCGKYRPGHFTGVATIVTKLFNIIQPDKAYFGQKDAQQLAIIKRLVQDLNLPVKIIGCPIVRETSGLALSSRNQYLSPTEKQQAAHIYRSLQKAKTACAQGEFDAITLVDLVEQELSAVPEVKIQYIKLVDPVSLQFMEEIKHTGLLAIAAYVGSTRLIDNIVLQIHQPIVAIDGPAGAGKSTVTRCLAHKLDLLYLDTGAMYRAVTWLVMQSRIAIEDQEAIATLINNLSLKLTAPQDAALPTIVHIDNQEVTEAIRTPEITANVSAIAAQAAVRAKLVEMQQQWGEKGGIVAEGRDIGTNVFPDAELKIFLTASVAERAKRRLQELQNQGRDDIDLLQLAQDIQQRDEQDSNRAIAPLKKADDAIEIITDNLTIEQVINKITTLYNQINS
jgi:pantoate ligase / CMP/dCMP kinase